MIRVLILLVGLCFCQCSFSEANDLYPLGQKNQSIQFQKLLHQFRCLVCQNQDLADSNAQLAKDLRQQIYDRVQRGQTDREIKGYLTERYGDFVLYQPDLKSNTLALWMAPIVIFLLAVLSYFCFLIQRKPQ